MKYYIILFLSYSLSIIFLLSTAYIPLYEYMVGGLSMKTMDVIQTHERIIQTPHTDDFHQIALAEATLFAVKEDCPLYLFTLGTLSRMWQKTIRYQHRLLLVEFYCNL